MFILRFFPVFFGLAILEAFWIARVQRRAYPWRESVASLLVAIGFALSKHVLARNTTPRPNDVDSVAEVAALFFCVELAYYWMHRMSHEVRWLWAAHAVHHSSNHFNFGAAYRLSWFGGLSGAWLFFIPLRLLGFSPAAIGAMLSFNLLFQFFLHTELVGPLGPFEWLLNTPTHHRVHHASNPRYLDKNYGGVLIIFDRLFGTFAELDETPRYGLVTPTRSVNPLRLVGEEWLRLARGIIRARGWRARVKVALGAPGAVK